MAIARYQEACYICTQLLYLIMTIIMSIPLYQIALHTKNSDIKNVKSVFHLPVTISLISNYAHGTLMPFFTTMK